MGYIPSKDADLINWGNNFASLITAAPTTYGLVSGDATVIQAAFDDLSAKYTLATDPSTRTKVTVAEKDGAKAEFLSLARSYAAMIRANGGVTDGDKTALGLNIPDPTKSPVPDPTTLPMIAIPLFGTNAHYFNITDQLTPDKKAHPFGVRGMVLTRVVGAAPVESEVGAVLVCLLNKSDELVSTEGLDKGKYATYFGRWYNSRGVLGPVSAPCSAVIA